MGSNEDLEKRNSRTSLSGPSTRQRALQRAAVADYAYLDQLLGRLPDDYAALSRLGLYGDYFAFYLCDLILKVNGKGGQPVFIKMASQTTGRCAPK